MKRTVDSIADLMPLVDLETLRSYEIVGQRRDGFSLEKLPAEVDGSALTLSFKVTDGRLVFRCRMEASTEQAVLRLDVAAIFRSSEPLEPLSEEVLEAFAREAGLPVLIPYLRVQVQQLAKQLGVRAPLLRHYWSKDYESLEFKATQENPRHSLG